MTSNSTLPRFLEKLKKITESTPQEIARWSKDGSRFEIHDSSFESTVLGKYFDAKQVLLSFSRQVGSNSIDVYPPLPLYVSIVELLRV